MAKKTAKAPASTDDLLLSLMEASGLSDYAIAKRCGVDPTQIGRFKRRERGITTETADKLFRGLGYDWPPPVTPHPPAATESGV
jgi:plasmid maintenance system antidote protein VapI